uniref:Uncharacterized protein n=1 Tax=Trypanosoma vivax (strain Y486) TaxID=1055687 RepID=G0TRF2_TRYVY|nr:conserved hypothetical protein [Trypanosoma vivax Y486]
MSRTFVSFNEKGKAEERHSAALPPAQNEKIDHLPRPQEIVDGRMSLVDRSYILNYLLSGSPMKYDAQTDTLQSSDSSAPESNIKDSTLLQLLTDDFAYDHHKEPKYCCWDSVTCEHNENKL